MPMLIHFGAEYLSGMCFKYCSVQPQTVGRTTMALTQLMDV